MSQWVALDHARDLRGPTLGVVEAGVPPGVHRVRTGEVELVPDEGNPSGWMVVVNGLESSYVDLGDPTWLEFEYVRWMGDVIDLIAEKGRPLRVAHLGGGGCTLPRYVSATRPGSRQLVVELDPDLLDLVRVAFRLDDLPGLELRAGDALECLAAEPGSSYDVVVRDAFDIDTVPSHLTTPEFLAEVRRVLAPGGTYLANVPAGADLHAARAEAMVAATVLPEVLLLVDPGQLRGRRFGNVVLVATDGTPPVELLSRRLAGGSAPARVTRPEDLAAR